jgi:hypothetical protein
VVLLIVVAAAAVSIAGLVKGVRPVCQVTTVTHAVGSAAGIATTKVCGTLGVGDYIYVLAIVGVLLLPDVKSLKIGGLEFERLTTEVAKQTSEIGQLQQTISAVVKNTNRISVQVGEVTRVAFGDFRAEFRVQRIAIEKIRAVLPKDPKTRSDLEQIDDIAKHIDAPDLDPIQLLTVLQLMHSLIAVNVTASVTEGDTLADAQRAEDILPGILGSEPAAS